MWEVGVECVWEGGGGMGGSVCVGGGMEVEVYVHVCWCYTVHSGVWLPLGCV